MGAFPCPLCGRSFASKHYLNQHVLAHSGEGGRFRCQQCDKSYLIVSHLADHMSSHSTTYDHLCDVCGRRFKHRKQLRVHAVLHKGIKPYRCDQCSYSASFLSGLARHKKTHAAPDQRPHPCPECPLRFLTRQNLQSHRRRRHRRHSATLLLALAAPAPAPAPAPAGETRTEDGPPAGEDSEIEDDPVRSPTDGDADSAELETDSQSTDTTDQHSSSGFDLSLPPGLARHDAFLEDDDTTSGCRLLDNVTLTSAAGREDADAGGQLLAARPDSPPAGAPSLADQLFAEAAAGVLDSTDPGAMVLDERVPMVGVEMELNDQ
ncbi:zinc finger protein 316-like [Amphibalanus amphitrite]|uniref:zinc finger protein 316-like n=1 Tax=Amphibalanus amphitrite TaxID=1232801 RepID=UPI001C90F155|nr:zinc finger protein 316-like [Amphibalanus amphitrite]